MFARFFRRREKPAITMIFLSKEDCHLCDVALEAVEQARRKYPFNLEVIKIQQGDEWWERYWDKIPVGLIDGAMIFKYRIEAEELVRKVKSRSQNLTS